MPKMRRQIIVHLLLACLLLATSALNHVTANVQAIQSVHSKLRTLQPITKPHAGHVNDVIPSWPWVEEKRNTKNPSGPNPIGNHHPPKP